LYYFKKQQVVLMPQLDLFTYSSQCFWFLIVFYTFYFFFIYHYAVSVAFVLKMRQKLFSLHDTKSKGSDSLLNLEDTYLLLVIENSSEIDEISLDGLDMSEIDAYLKK
jgi:hypothetical protein